MLTECAIYAGGSRQPWSEPPMLDPPQVEEPPDLDAAIRDGDRLAAERWLSFHLDAPELEESYFEAASRDFEDLGHKLIVESRLAPRPDPRREGSASHYFAPESGSGPRIAARRSSSAARQVDRDALIERLVADVIEERGSLIATHNIFLLDAALGTPGGEARARLPV